MVQATAIGAIESECDGVPLVCPLCRKGLDVRQDHLLCPACDRADCPKQFECVDGFPNLVVGGRLDDEEDDARSQYEEQSNVYTARNYWIPVFRRLTRSLSRRPRVLAVGCGCGVEVDMLLDAGFDCVGIDCGMRSTAWPRRSHRSALLLANGMNLPFADGAFDLAYCGCVFPHVGVVGGGFELTQHYREDRLAVAREMARVVKPGGHIVVTSPNRRFPFDLFHGRDAGGCRVRANRPGDRFLLSVNDYAELFRESGCAAVDTLPVTGYWGFVRSKHTWKGYLMGLPVRSLFWLVDRPQLHFLRGSPLAPWIAVHIQR